MGRGRILNVLALWIEDILHLSVCALGWTGRGLHVLGEGRTLQGIHCPVFEASTLWTPSRILTS